MGSQQAALSDNPLVSIVMAAYNAEATVQEAVDSVLHQAYQHIELIVVDDGSTDSTPSILASNNDPRMRYIRQANGGVSSARNTGLAEVKGEVLVFCDADDRLTSNSIQDRVQVLQNNLDVDFVDGAMRVFDRAGNASIRTPNYRGAARPALLRIDPNCFMGITWMIRLKPEKTYRFKVGLTHGEDLLFYLSIADKGQYRAVSTVCYERRVVEGSAMSNLNGIDKGYRAVHEALKADPDYTTDEVRSFKRQIKRIMCRTYLKSFAIRDYFRWRFY